jgi:uncharacterized membrane protein
MRGKSHSKWNPLLIFQAVMSCFFFVVGLLCLFTSVLDAAVAHDMKYLLAAVLILYALLRGYRVYKIYHQSWQED